MPWRIRRRIGAPPEIDRYQLRVRVNGRWERVVVGPESTLLTVLRDHLGLIGTKEACGQGACGSCTVLVNGRAMMSCVALACHVRGEIWTIEGLAPSWTSLREAFADGGGAQCGYCTPGQIVRATEVLSKGLPDSDNELRRLMSGNICRCTGYAQIVASIRQAANRMTAQKYGTSEN